MRFIGDTSVSKLLRKYLLEPQLHWLGTQSSSPVATAASTLNSAFGFSKQVLDIKSPDACLEHQSSSIERHEHGPLCERSSVLEFGGQLGKPTHISLFKATSIDPSTASSFGWWHLRCLSSKTKAHSNATAKPPTVIDSKRPSDAFNQQKPQQQLRSPPARVADLLINHCITSNTVEVQSADGPVVVGLAEALQKAADQGLDLVQLPGENTPPKVQIMDYRKYRYERQQALEAEQHAARIQAKKDTPKEARLTSRTSPYDMSTKLKRVREWLKDGYKVAVVVEIKHGSSEEEARAKLNSMLSQLAEISELDKGCQVTKKGLMQVIKPRPLPLQ